MEICLDVCKNRDINKVRGEGNVGNNLHKGSRNGK